MIREDIFSMNEKALIQYRLQASLCSIISLSKLYQSFHHTYRNQKYQLLVVTTGHFIDIERTASWNTIFNECWHFEVQKNSADFSSSDILGDTIMSLSVLEI